MSRTHDPRTRFLLPTLVLGISLATGTFAQDGVDDPAGTHGYSYVRILEGAAGLLPGEGGDPVEARLHQPVLAGDRLTVAAGGRVEVELSDWNRLRLAGDAAVVLDRVALAPETTDRRTEVTLLWGDVQLAVVPHWSGDEPPLLRLPAAELHLQGEGAYRVGCDGTDHCRVTVRSGSAEIVTERGSLLLHAGEQAELNGGPVPRLAIATAGAFDTLERWALRLEVEADAASPAEVPEPLRYSAARLADYGEWIDVEGVRAFRPRVGPSWRPYWHGSFHPTPAGLGWVSSEPWGWVPYHYGSWSFHPHHGWVWCPGVTFSPAWVVWYWGPTHVAWVPTGYYRPFFRHHHGYGLRVGVYGYAGGHYDHYRDWVFCDLHRFRHRDLHHLVSGHDLQRRSRGSAVPRGVITTDTRGLAPHQAEDAPEILRRLADRPPRRAAVPRQEGGELPDVTPFVLGDPQLSPVVARRVLTPVDPAGPTPAPGDRPVRRGLVGTAPTPPTTAGEGTGTEGAGRGRRALAVPSAPANPRLAPPVEAPVPRSRPERPVVRRQPLDPPSSPLSPRTEGVPRRVVPRSTPAPSAPTGGVSGERRGVSPVAPVPRGTDLRPVPPRGREQDGGGPGLRTQGPRSVRPAPPPPAHRVPLRRPPATSSDGGSAPPRATVPPRSTGLRPLVTPERSPSAGPRSREGAKAGATPRSGGEQRSGAAAQRDGGNQNDREGGARHRTRASAGGGN
jgi:hypothetical protein